MSNLEVLLELAAADPDFHERLLQDPVGAAHAAQLTLSPADLRELPAVLAGADRAAVEHLQARVSQQGRGANVSTRA